MRFFFFNDAATTEIYTLSLHDALPISPGPRRRRRTARVARWAANGRAPPERDRDRGRPGRSTRRRRSRPDRKSTRLNSSHANISYAVFCLKKKKHSYTSITFTLMTHPL